MKLYISINTTDTDNTSADSAVADCRCQRYQPRTFGIQSLFYCLGFELNDPEESAVLHSKFQRLFTLVNFIKALSLSHEWMTKLLFLTVRVAGIQTLAANQHFRPTIF